MVVRCIPAGICPLGGTFLRANRTQPPTGGGINSLDCWCWVRSAFPLGERGLYHGAAAREIFSVLTTATQLL